MATKQDLLNEVVAKSWKGWHLIFGNDPIIGADGKTITEYTVNYAENLGGKLVKRNLGMYVYQEGLGDEDAQWRDQPKTKDTARGAVLSYLDGLAYVRYELESLDEDARYGFARAWKDNGDSTVSEVRLMIWKDGGSPIQSAEVV